MWGNAGLPLGREKLFRLVAFTARGRKHTRQGKTAIGARHQIEAHLRHIPLQVSENLRSSAVVLNDCVMLLVTVAPLRRQTILEPR